MIGRRRRRMYVDDLPKTHDARFLIVFLMCCVVALGGVYVVGYVVAGDKVPSGTTVARVEIGGMSQAEAATRLRQQAATFLDQRLTVSAGGHQISLTPRAAGVSLDVEATIDAAMDGGKWNPWHMLRVLEGGEAVTPVFTIDDTRLAAALAPLAEAVVSPPESSSVSVVGDEPVVHPGHPGHKLDIAVAPYQFTIALQDDQDQVRLGLTDKPPPIDFATATTFAKTTLRDALGATVEVRVGDHSLRVAPHQFGPALKAVPRGGKLRLRIAPDVLFDHTRTLLDGLPGAPVDAHITFEGGQPAVVAGHPGLTVAREPWARAVLAATAAPGRQAQVTSTLVDPDFTTADATSLHLVSRLGTASGVAQPLRRTAFDVAVARLNTTVTLPGGTFSYFQTVGATGSFTLVSALEDVTEAAAEQARMTLTQRPGTSAGGSDLQFRNPSTYPVYLRCWTIPRRAGELAVFVQIWGT